MIGIRSSNALDSVSCELLWIILLCVALVEVKFSTSMDIAFMYFTDDTSIV